MSQNTRTSPLNPFSPALLPPHIRLCSSSRTGRDAPSGRSWPPRSPVPSAQAEGPLRGPAVRHPRERWMSPGTARPREDGVGAFSTAESSLGPRRGGRRLRAGRRRQPGLEPSSPHPPGKGARLPFGESPSRPVFCQAARCGVKTCPVRDLFGLTSLGLKSFPRKRLNLSDN